MSTVNRMNQSWQYPGWWTHVPSQLVTVGPRGQTGLSCGESSNRGYWQDSRNQAGVRWSKWIETGSSAHMKTVPIFFCLLIWVIGCTGPGKKSAAVSRSPAMIAFLQGLTDQCAKEDLNVFFISPVVKTDGASRVYVYWMTDNSILPLSWPPEQVRDSVGYISEYSYRINLANGVVPTRRDIGSSTYLIDLDWAAGILQECMGSGSKILLQRGQQNIGNTVSQSSHFRP